VVSPTGRSQHLKLVLFAPSEQGQQYVAAGSLGLDSLLGSDTPHQRVTVPVVDEASFACCLGWAGSNLHVADAGHTPLGHLRRLDSCFLAQLPPLCCPAVAQVGKHAGAVDCTLRFPSRPTSAADGGAVPEAG